MGEQLKPQSEKETETDEISVFTYLNEKTREFLSGLGIIYIDKNQDDESPDKIVKAIFNGEELDISGLSFPMIQALNRLANNPNLPNILKIQNLAEDVFGLLKLFVDAARWDSQLSIENFSTNGGESDSHYINIKRRDKKVEEIKKEMQKNESGVWTPLNPALIHMISSSSEWDESERFNITLYQSIGISRLCVDENNRVFYNLDLLFEASYSPNPNNGPNKSCVNKTI